MIPGSELVDPVFTPALLFVVATGVAGRGVGDAGMGEGEAVGIGEGVDLAAGMSAAADAFSTAVARAAATAAIVARAAERLAAERVAVGFPADWPRTKG